MDFSTSGNWSEYITNEFRLLLVCNEIFLTIPETDWKWESIY